MMRARCEEHSVWAEEKVSHERVSVKHCLNILIILISNYTLALAKPNLADTC